MISPKRKVCLMLLAFTMVGFAAAHASSDLDYRYELSSIGVLRSWDNVDGLFTQFVTEAYGDYFSHQTRFVLNELSSVDSLLDHSKLPYAKLILDRDILSQLAKSSRSQSILRTKIIKQFSQYHFVLDWLHYPKMDLLASVEFNMEEPAEGKTLTSESIKLGIRQALNKLFTQVPFFGNVTGRDGQSVTINLGAVSGIKKGDTLSIKTLDEVKQHPLLRQIVEWRSTATGQIQVEQADESLSFCKIIQEEPGREISKGQKIFQIQKASIEQQIEASIKSNEKQEAIPPKDLHKIANLALSAFPGFYDRQYSDLSQHSLTGGGLAFGGALAGEIVLTREWFAGLDFRFSFLNFSQTKIATGVQTTASKAGGVSASDFYYKLTFGYMFLLNGDPTGPKGWLKAGYKSDSYSIPTTSSEYTGPLNFNSVFLGAGGDLPLRNDWGLTADLSFRLFTTVTHSWISSSSNGSSDVEFYLGSYHRLGPDSTLRLGLNIISNGVTFADGTSINQKSVSFVPALLYYF